MDKKAVTTKNDALVEVEVIKDYKDLEKMLLFNKGEKHAVTEKRAELLEKRNLVKRVDKTAPKDNKEAV